MDICLSFVFVILNYFIIFELSYQTVHRIAIKNINAQRLEDYTFEGELNRAKDECSYMTIVNNTYARNKTIQSIKKKISNRRLKEFYEQKDIEKQRAKQYYENIEKQARKRILESERFDWKPNFPVPKTYPLPPNLPPRKPFIPQPYPPRVMYKRSTEWDGRRRKTSSSFTEVSFADHNNCSSRCIFARMEMVNPLGFPDESLIIKLIDDKITNKKLRLSKMEKVASCFNKMKEVTFDDSCIFSARLFNCLCLGESYLWSNNS